MLQLVPESWNACCGGKFDPAIRFMQAASEIARLACQKKRGRLLLNVLQTFYSLGNVYYSFPK